jgi:BirA family biotin operon repressor/biotin-[acetyl-CoA-carboxylase] ligase
VEPDCCRIALLSAICIVERAGSTNAALLADDHAKQGDWLVALHQESGRGRHGRVWESVSGNFLGSTIVELTSTDPPAPTLTLVAGLALIEAVNAIAPDAKLSLKWPNDLMLGDAKVAGILLERSASRVVVGFGVNLAGAPSIAGRKIASLHGLSEVSPQAFAPTISASFARALGRWRMAPPGAIAEAWMERAHPVGTRLEVHSGPGERIVGSFDGIEPDGAMRLLRADGQVDLVRAGDVSLA